MKIIKKSMIYLCAFFFISAINANTIHLTSFNIQTSNQIGLTGHTNVLHAKQAVFFEQCAKLSDQLTFNYVRPSDILMPENCQQAVNKIDQTYKNFHIFISAMPLYKIEQLSEHHFPTTFPL
ncbi:MAG: hypothetical protein P4L22_00600 [Candidatus Babeliales bacterium]|nr:hypothetical protein [Candidatus Babeliales bacterium]